jgi:hypothetical protein
LRPCLIDLAAYIPIRRARISIVTLVLRDVNVKPVKEEIVADNGELNLEPMKFESILQAHVPKGRDGKHKGIITQLLSDIARLGPGAALRIPLAQLPDTKQNIRAALSRAASQRKIDLATSSNNEFLYVWKREK